MSLSLLQKIEILVIKIFLRVIGSLDYISVWLFYRKSLRLVVNVCLILITLNLFYIGLYHQNVFNLQKKLNLFYLGLNTEINGQLPNINISRLNDSSPLANINSMTLGASHQRSIPKMVNEIAFPFITAKSHLLIDVNSQTILSEHNLHRPFAPASTTKLMTVLVALDLYSLDDELPTNDYCYELDSTKLWLPLGYKFRVKDLIYSSLISSAADSACILATTKVSESEFVELMNKKASSLGMKDTHFTNAVGLDGENGSHYASVWDLFLLSKEITNQDLLKEIIKMKDYHFATSDEKYDFKISNTNKLLWEIPESIGIKTGTTSGAGEVLIYEYQKDKINLIIIVMSSEDRFKDTKSLLDWSLKSYEW